MGAVAQTAPTRIPALTCHFRMPARCRRRPRHRGLPRRPVCRGPPRCADWGGGERFPAGLVPDLVVARILQDAAPGGLEDPPIQGRAEPLDVRAEQHGQDRGMGMVRVSLSARCFRPRSWRAVPSSVQGRPTLDAEADKTIRPTRSWAGARAWAYQVTASSSVTSASGRPVRGSKGRRSWTASFSSVRNPSASSRASGCPSHSDPAPPHTLNRRIRERQRQLHSAGRVRLRPAGRRRPAWSARQG